MTFMSNNTLLAIRKTASPILWLDAEDSSVTLISGVVSQWNDKSGNNYHATQSIVADRPTYSTTISPRRVYFLGSDRMFASLPSLNNAITIIGTANGTAAYTITIPSGSYTIGRHDGIYMPDSNVGTPVIYSQVILPSTATQTDINYWTNYIRNKGAGNSYGNTIDFSNYWRNWTEIVSFPLINTGSATTLASTWSGCTRLSNFPLINTSSVTNFSGAWTNCTNLNNFPLINTAAGTNFLSTWANCTSLTSFPLLNMSSAVSLQGAWSGCNSLTSFPLINMSNVSNLQQAWNLCTGLISFPAIDTSNVTNLFQTWIGCINLTSFPIINTPKVTNFANTWWNCRSLTSFPLLPSVTAATTFQGAWYGCLALTTFPANFFNGCAATNFGLAFANTALSQNSIDNILTSINSNNTSNGTFQQSGGSAPSATGQAAITAMRSRGWTVNVTGGF